MKKTLKFWVGGWLAVLALMVGVFICKDPSIADAMAGEIMGVPIEKPKPPRAPEGILVVV